MGTLVVSKLPLTVCTAVLFKFGIAFPDKDLGRQWFFNQLNGNNGKASVLLKAVVKASENKITPHYGMFYKSSVVPSL